MGCSSKVLLDLECKNPSSSSIESTLLVCKNNGLLLSQTTKTHASDGKPISSSVPKSQAVLGRVKDFLGVISEANKRLQLDARENSKDYDIEVLTGNESEYIEMDLMLGVADLHTPEAVAAAESAIAVSYQPVIPLAANSNGTESEDSSDDSDDSDGDDTCSPTKFKRSKPAEVNTSTGASRNSQAKKRAKILSSHRTFLAWAKQDLKMNLA